MKTHTKLINDTNFSVIKSGRKKFRVCCCDYWVGDLLILTNSKTKKKLTTKITYIDNEGTGLRKGFMVFGIEIIEDDKEKKEIDKKEKV